MKFEYLEHTADIKFRAYGKGLEKVFINSALAFRKSMVKKVRGRKKQHIIVEGKDLENLMYNFLEELLFLIDTSGFILSRVKKINIDLKKFKLEAELVGDRVSKYEFMTEVKAITYQELIVREEDGKWVVQVVLDV
ncbi:archease [Candidatus Woesearchaeota archaeon]|jgi:SHS2 domain-containing protein|nr:archease [Candidatus Woesearchaeota archaeon]